MIEVAPARTATVGTTTVRRALPQRTRRTVGAWCFADHMGPAPYGPDNPLDVGPHPHIGLHTVTWLTSGALVHHDSLGSEQPIRPGQLNVMTSGHGVVHAEQSDRTQHGQLEGIQLWVAQPEATRHGPASFTHHAEVPRGDIGGGIATVLAGDLAGVIGAAQLDSPLVGAELRLHQQSAVALEPTFEHAVVVLSGSLALNGTPVAPGQLAWIPPGTTELVLDPLELGPGGANAIAILLGGAPFGEQVAMWWNFVARTPEELRDAAREWAERTSRFGPVATTLTPIDAPAYPR